MKNKEMEKEKFKKAINSIKTISLTKDEKEDILNKILIKKNKKSPWFSYFDIQARVNVRYYTLASLALMVILGSSVVYASRDALPGDLLYKIKTNIREPLKISFASTDIEKASLEAQFLEYRLQEKETLFQAGRLDPIKEQEIDEVTNKQISKLSDAIEKIKDKNPGDADDLKTTAEANISAYSKIMSFISSTTTDRRQEEMKKKEIKKEEVKNESDKDKKAEDGKSDESKNIAEKNIEKRKKKIESILEISTTPLSATTSPEKTQPVNTKKSIEDNIKERINNARSKLEESSLYEKKGEKDNSYSAFLESERSAKEADILIKAKERIEKMEDKKEGNDKKQVDKKEDKKSRNRD